MVKPGDETVIASLTSSVGVTGDVLTGPTYASRLHHVSDDSHFTVIALPAAKREFSLCLARGLQHDEGRQLRLVLPKSKAGPVLAWSAYLEHSRRPEVWLHDDWQTPKKVELPSRKQVVEHLRGHASLRTQIDDPKLAVEQLLRQRSEPKHLGERGAYVYDLIEWATSREELDASHNQGSRSWQYRGRKVLEIKTTRGGVWVIAGINGKRRPVKNTMTPGDLADVVTEIEAGIEARRSGDHRKADESWLQSFIGRSPRIVGIETRAFREVPGWRPKGPGGAMSTYGTGRIDLLGVDGHGTVRIVETKLPSNSDAAGLGFQAVDYLTYCEAYRDPICRRLDVSPKATFALRYVLGQEERDRPHLHPAAVATMRALDPNIEYDVQGIAGWFVEPGKESRGRSVDVLDAPRTWPKPVKLTG